MLKVIAVAYERIQLKAFGWENFGALVKWSLMVAGRLRNAVAHAGSTVLANSFC